MTDHKTDLQEQFARKRHVKIPNVINEMDVTVKSSLYDHPGSP